MACGIVPRDVDLPAIITLLFVSVGDTLFKIFWLPVPSLPEVLRKLADPVVPVSVV